MENRLPQPCPAKFGDKDQCQEGSTHSLTGNGDNQDHPGDVRQVRQRCLVQVLAQDQPLRHANGDAKRAQQQYRKGHEAETAKLDQRRNDCLPKARESRPGIKEHQPCDGYRKRRCE